MTAQLSRERLEEILHCTWMDDLGISMAELNEMARMLLAGMDSEPVAWTDEQELRDLEKSGCAYLFTVNPITPNADARRVIRLYTAPPAPLREYLQHQASGNRPAVWVRIGDNNHAPDCTLDHDEAREWESRGLEVLRMVAPAPVAVPDEIKRNPETGWYVGPDGKNWSAMQANSWNACRAAMLKADGTFIDEGTKQVTAATVPDGDKYE